MPNPIGRPPGIPHTQEWKDRHSKMMKGRNNPQFGKPLSVQQRQTLDAGYKAWLETHKPPFQTLFFWLRQTAKKCGQPLGLTFDEFTAFTKTNECTYCGGTVLWIDKQGKAYNLDRKDNTQGYSSSNCVVCCPGCNRIKSNRFSYEEMMEIGRIIRRLREKQ